MTVPPPFPRRTLLGGALGAAAVALLPHAADAAEPAVVGRVRDTWLAAGGARVVGTPLAVESRVRIDGRNTYGQRFRSGQVWWGSGVGRVDLPAGARVRLTTAPNFRPVLGVAGVWRTDDLDGATPLEERVVRDLGITTMVAMNTGPDPVITGVRNLSFPVSNAGTYLEFYRGYVTRSASRAAFGQVLTTVATSTAPVLVHCAGGKDRTGWTAELLQRVAGVPQARRDADYLATRAYSGGHVDLTWLQAARARLSADYGTLESYLRRGCGMTAAHLTLLRTRLTPTPAP